MKISFLFVFLGGALGAMIRECVIIFSPTLSNGFPLNIFICNVLASFLLGLVTHGHRINKITDEMVIFLGVGLLGGMSTFSSYIYGGFSEWNKAPHDPISFIYLISSLVIGFITAWVGLYFFEKKNPLEKEDTDIKKEQTNIENTQ